MAFDFDAFSMESDTMTEYALQRPRNHLGFKEIGMVVPHYLVEGDRCK